MTATTQNGARVRVSRDGSLSLVRWYCGAACAAEEPDKQRAPARAPAIVPKGKRCSRCHRKLAEHG